MSIPESATYSEEGSSGPEDDSLLKCLPIMSPIPNAESFVKVNIDTIDPLSEPLSILDFMPGATSPSPNSPTCHNSRPPGLASSRPFIPAVGPLIRVFPHHPISHQTVSLIHLSYIAFPPSASPHGAHKLVFC